MATADEEGAFNPPPRPQRKSDGMRRSAAPSVSVETTDIAGEVYITEAHLSIEREYLARVAKRVHRSAVAELDKQEEMLFMLFTRSDDNMDGTMAKDEMTNLLKEVDEKANVDEVLKVIDKNGDGVVSFIELLKWMSGGFGPDAPKAEGNSTFVLKSMVVGTLGSGYLGCDEKIDTLGLESLNQNIVGYRKILYQIAEYKIESKLNALDQTEKETGLNADLLIGYHKLLVAEFQGDMSLLFDLFIEVDDSGNLLLEADEVNKLLKMLDTSASDEDCKKYMEDVQMENGALTYGLFVAWWDSSISDPSGVLAEKGMSLMASIKARSLKSSLSSWVPGESSLHTAWRSLEETDKGKLAQYKEGLKGAVLEIRRYKMAKRIKESETGAMLSM